MRYIELRQGDAHEVAPFAADHFAMRNVFTQVLAHFPPHNLAEASVIVVDVEDHFEADKGNRGFRGFYG